MKNPRKLDARKINAVRNRALQLAGAIAIGTAGYHGISGDRLLRAMDLPADDMEFVTGTYQLGTMGWVAGGVLLLGAARMSDAQARNWIVGVTSVLFGIPAVGTLALTGGEINLGGSLLAAVVVLALWGRALPQVAAGTVEPVAGLEAVPELVGA